MNQKEVVKKSLEQMHLLPNSLLKGNPIVLLLTESICGSCDLIHRIVETAECFKSLTVNRGLLDRFLLCAVQHRTGRRGSSNWTNLLGRQRSNGRRVLLMIDTWLLLES